MRQHLCCAVIHLLPEKSLSLTSLANTRARCSIQTTDAPQRRIPLQLSQAWQHRCPFQHLVRLTTVEERWASSLRCFDQAGFHLLARLLPDDGSRFPLCLWIWGWSSASRVCRSEEITLMKNTFLYLLYHTQSQCSSDCNPPMLANHFMTAPSE